MVTLVQKILKLLTKIYLWKNKPKVIAITGSVGKTTTRKAVTLMVERNFSTRPFEENSYNSEIGLPLAVLGQHTPIWKIGWLWVIFKGFLEIIFGKQFDVLVLEMGADKIGDIKYLTDIAKPEVSIVTKVGPSHLDRFKTVEEVLKEKSKLVEVLDEKDTAILNNDDSLVMTMKDITKAKIITYGFSEEADAWASDIEINMLGTSFCLHFLDHEIKVEIASIGEHLVYPVLAAVCVGLYFDYSEEDIKEAIKNFSSVKGRLRVIEGIRETYLIDDSYNSNPPSAINSIKTLAQVAPARKIAVLGTMNEMGDYFQKAHEGVGQFLADKIDVLVTVGEGGKIIAEKAKDLGFSSDKIYIFDNSEKAGHFLESYVKNNDTVLFKGSQNKVRLEKAVKILMKNKDQAEKLLVRQGRAWQNK